jgi:hypothetical protein
MMYVQSRQTTFAVGGDPRFWLRQNARSFALSALLTSRADIIRTTAAADEFGTTSETKYVVARYPCRVTLYAEGGKGDEPLIAEQTVARTLWRIYLPPTAKIDPTDTIRVGDFTYTVLESTEGRADAAILCVFARRER